MGVTMKWSINGKILQNNQDKQISFPYQIGSILEFEDGVLIILDIPKDKSMTENVFFINNDTSIRWQIAPYHGTSLAPENYYVGARAISRNRVWLSNWNGIAVEVDIVTGSIIGYRETK